MSKILDELRRVHPEWKARDALLALGLDESLLDHPENPMTAKPTKFANLALQLTASYIKPFLAKDAKIDLMPVFKDVTSKNFDAKKVRMALDTALKGKLAKDADPHMGHVAQLMDHLEGAKAGTADESVSEAEQKAMGAAAAGNSNLDMPKGKSFDASIEPLKAYLKEKGAEDDVIGGACDMVRDMMMPPNALDAEETEEEKTAREKKEAEAKEAKAADAKTAADAEAAEAEKNAKGEDEMKDMVKKPAMDAAIKLATDLTAKKVKAEVIETQRAIRQAENAVKPYVGELASDLAFDSAADVYAAALKMRGVDVKDVHPSAFPKLLELLPKAGARAVEQGEKIAMDSGSSGFAERHPEAARIQSI